MFNKTHYLALLGIAAFAFNVHCSQSMQDIIKAHTEEIPCLQGLYELRDIPFPFKEKPDHLEASIEPSLEWLKENKELSNNNKAYISQLFSRIRDQKHYFGSLTHCDKYCSILVYTPAADQYASNLLKNFLTSYRALTEANPEIGLENVCFANSDSLLNNGWLKINGFVDHNSRHDLTSYQKRAWHDFRFIHDKDKKLASYLEADHTAFDGALAAVIYDRKVRERIPYHAYMSQRTGMHMAQHIYSVIKRLR